MIMLPKDDIEKQTILSEIASKFEKDRNYTDGQVNRILKDLETEDHVLFRRELVNFNYLGRDAYKGIFWVKTHKLTEEQLKKIGKNQSKIKKF